MAVVHKTTTYPPAYLGVPYEAGIAVTEAGTLTGIAVGTGALPAGITVSSTTDPRLVGTPTVTGVFTFTLTVNDGSGAVVSGSNTLTVFGAPGDLEDTGVTNSPSAVMKRLRLA